MSKNFLAFLVGLLLSASLLLPTHSNAAADSIWVNCLYVGSFQEQMCCELRANSAAAPEIGTGLSGWIKISAGTYYYSGGYRTKWYSYGTTAVSSCSVIGKTAVNPYVPCQAGFEFDAGYNCIAIVPTEPATCDDHLLTAGEQGIDCGGDCIETPCVWKCPEEFPDESAAGCYSASVHPNSEWQALCPSGAPLSECPGATAVCPSGSTALFPEYPSICFVIKGKQLAAASETFSNSDEPGGFSTIEYTNTSTSASSTVTNPDNTTTTTTTKTSSLATTSPSSPSGSSSTTIITTVRNPDGSVASETEETTGGTGITPTASPVVNLVATPETDRFSTRYSTFTTILKTAPVLAPFTTLFNPTLSAGVSAASFNLGSYGSKSFDLTAYSSAFSYIRIFLTLLAMFAAARIVFLKR